MSNLAKVGIVVLLAVAVGAVVIAKRSSNSPVNTTTSAGEIAARTAQPDLPTSQPVKAALPRLVDLGAG